MKDYFLEKEDKLLNGGDEIFSNMLQAVRCCNDQYLMSLFKELPEHKQFQLGKRERWPTRLYKTPKGTFGPHMFKRDAFFEYNTCDSAVYLLH